MTALRPTRATLLVRCERLANEMVVTLHQAQNETVTGTDAFATGINAIKLANALERLVHELSREQTT